MRLLKAYVNCQHRESANVILTAVSSSLIVNGNKQARQQQNH